MKASERADYGRYRLQKAHEAWQDAKVLADHQRWNASINRLYYACFYAASALLIEHGITTLTHNGVKIQLNLQFVKKELLSKENGKLYAQLFNWRQKGDYGDFYDFDEETVKSLLTPVQQFIDQVEALLH